MPDETPSAQDIAEAIKETTDLARELGFADPEAAAALVDPAKTLDPTLRRHALDVQAATSPDALNPQARLARASTPQAVRDLAAGLR